MKTLRVNAIQPGYYGNVRRDPGTELGTFVLKEESEFSSVWMEPVGWEPGKAAPRDPLDHDGDGKKGGGPVPKKVQPIQASLETTVTPSDPVVKADI
jgi:hypothetical protein